MVNRGVGRDKGSVVAGAIWMLVISLLLFWRPSTASPRKLGDFLDNRGEAPYL